MTGQLRPGVIAVALVALMAGVLGLRMLASGETDEVPAGQPFVIEADYPDAVEPDEPEADWTRSATSRNPFVPVSGSRLAVGGARGTSELDSDPNETDPEGDGLEPADELEEGEQGLAPTSDPAPDSDNGASAPLGNAAEPPRPGEVIQIEIGPGDPNGTGSGGSLGG